MDIKRIEVAARASYDCPPIDFSRILGFPNRLASETKSTSLPCFRGVIMITQPDYMLWFFCHIWVKTTFNMRIIWRWCLLIICKGMLHVGFMSVFLRNLLLPLQSSSKYFWSSGIMMEMILNHSMLNHSLRPIWSNSFLWKSFIRNILRYVVSTWWTTPNIQEFIMIPLSLCMKSH